MTAPRPAGDAPMDWGFLGMVQEYGRAEMFGDHDGADAGILALWSWHVAQVAAAREAAIREAIAMADEVSEANQGINDYATGHRHAADGIAARLRALLPAPDASNDKGVQDGI